MDKYQYWMIVDTIIQSHQTQNMTQHNSVYIGFGVSSSIRDFHTLR